MSEITTLKNGLRIVTDETPHLESIALGVWANVGSRYETPAHNGISHMLEHMMFKGTETRSSLQIAEEIENVGGHLNAYTSRDKTAYHARALKEDVGLCVEVLSDMLKNSVFDAKELEQEKSVVLQEIGQTFDTPDDIIFDYLQETAFAEQALGRPILGTAETVQGISGDDLRSYVKTYYNPDNLVLSASGNINHAHFVDLAEEAFGSLKSAPKQKTVTAKYQGGDFRKQQDLEQLHMLLVFQGIPHDDPDYYALSVFSALFGGGMSSRLFQEVREKRGLAYSIYNFAASYQDTGLWGIYTGTDAKKGPEALSVIREELHRLENTLKEEEINRAKAQLKAGLLMSLEKPMSRCEQMAAQMLIFDRLIPLSEIIEKVEAVDKAQIIALTKRLLSTAPTFAALGDVKNLTPYDKLV